jgi:hypothetical protein
MEQSICQRCSELCGRVVHRMHISINLAAAPPGLEPEVDACPCCHPIWADCHVQPVTLNTQHKNRGGNIGTNAISNEMIGRQAQAPQAQQQRQPQRLEPSYSSSSTASSSSSYGAGGTDYGAAASGVGVDIKKKSGPGSRGGRGSGNTATTATSAAGRGGRSGRASQQQQQQPPDLMCECGKPAHIGVTRKEGPNKGRQFASCPDNKA